MAASYGVDYRWPMLDRRLIERYLATPSIEKRHRRWGRYLHRRACEGTIPQTILWKESKELGGIPHIGRDRRLVVPDVNDLAPAVNDIVDRDAVARQAQDLQRAMSDPALWFAKNAERNNLQALSALGIWLNGVR